MPDCTTGCGRPSPDAYICQHCADELDQVLAELPSLEVERQIVLGKQTVYGERNGSRSANRGLPYDQRASELGWVVRNTLTTWVRLLHDQSPGDSLPADTIPAMAHWLRRRLPHVRQHEAAGEIVDEITALAAEIRRCIDRPNRPLYAGPCACGTDLFVQPGESAIQCRGCGTGWDLLAHSRDQLVTATEAADALTAWGQRVSANLIRQWASRGRIERRAANQRGHAMYRLGDVMDRLTDGAKVKVS